jgi:hypothetical protein
MIDLSITQNPDWIKKREELWKPIEASYKEHLRKNEIEPIHHYFMTGTLRPGDNLSEEIQFDWFPIQNTEAWDYLYQNAVKNTKTYEKQFYFQFDDLSKRALNHEQELEMWDYFSGDTFKPVVISRVAIGNVGSPFHLVVDKANVIAKFSMNIKGIGDNKKAYTPKWMERISYFLTLLPTLDDEHFQRKTKFSDFNSREGELIKYIFRFLFKPKFSLDLLDVDSEWIEKRIGYLEELKLKLELVEMQPAMRELWEETKKKYGK